MFSGAGLSTGGTHERRWRRGTATATASRVVLVSKRAGSLTRNTWRTSDPILFCLSLWPGRDAWTLQAAARGNPAETQQVPARRGGRLLRGLSCSPPLVRRWELGYASLYTPPTTTSTTTPPSSCVRPGRSTVETIGLVVAEWRSHSANLGGRGGHQACCRCPLPGHSLLIQSFWRPGLAWISTPF